MTPERYEKIRSVINAHYDAGVTNPDNDPDADNKTDDIFDTWSDVKEAVSDATRAEFESVCSDILETIDRHMREFWMER